MAGRRVRAAYGCTVTPDPLRWAASAAGAPVRLARALPGRLPGPFGSLGSCDTATTPAPPAVVWRLLGDPDRWPLIHPLVRRVPGVSGPAREGQHLLVVGRGLGLRIPVDVLDADGDRRLALLVHTLPGLREELVVELAPSFRGGTQVTVHGRPDGPFGRLGAVPLWFVDRLVTRMIVVAATREGRRVARAGTTGAA